MKDILAEKRHCAGCAVELPVSDLEIMWDDAALPKAHHRFYCQRCAPVHVPLWGALLHAVGVRYDADEAAKAKAQSETE